MAYEYLNKLSKEDLKVELIKCIRLNESIFETLLRSEAEIASLKRSYAAFNESQAELEKRIAGLAKKV